MANPIYSLGFYVINVASQYSRRLSAENEARKFHLVPIFVPAVTPGESKQTRSRFVSPGVRAVWESHMKALQTFLHSDEEFAIIAEDDFQFVDVKTLKDILSSQKTYDYDFIQLGYLQPGIDTRIAVIITNWQQKIFRMVARVTNFSFMENSRARSRMRVRDAQNLPKGMVAYNAQPGAHFYLISRRFAELIPLLNDPQFLSIDDFYSSLARMRSFKMSRTRKSLVSQKDFESWSGNRFINN